MKKIYTSIFALLLLVSMQSNAQVSVTYQVDITAYLTPNPDTLGANGMRIGGNFTTVGSTLPDWTPSDAACGMTQQGTSNIWSITVDYPASAVGTTQNFKFVNNDWGTNEGDAASNIATNGCGVDDGAGNINRQLVIPATNTTLLWCYNECATCEGSPASASTVNIVNNFNVFPNPTTNNSVINFSTSNTEMVNIDLVNSLGQISKIVASEKLNAGKYTREINVSDLTAGIYFIRLTTGSETQVIRFNISK